MSKTKTFFANANLEINYFNKHGVKKIKIINAYGKY